MTTDTAVKQDISQKETPTAQPPLKKMRVSELLGIPQAPHVPIAPDQNKTILTASGEWAAAEAITKAMPKDHGVPLTILTGFLGAGKSTVLNYILKADHGLKIAVLINEFGEVDIDNQLVDTMTKGQEGKPIMLNNGCVCCTISTGFADAVRQTLEDADARGRFPDYFIVETTGLADPKPIMDTVSMTELRDDLYMDQILTVVDASAWTDEHYESDTAMRQIEAADTILLSKTDLTDDDGIDAVVESITAVRPNARILRSQKGYVPIAALFDLGVSMKSGDSSGKRKAPPNDGKSNDAHADHAKEKGHGEHHDGHEHKHDHDHEHDHKHDHDHKHEHKHGEDCGADCGHKKVENTKRNHLEEEGFSSISFVTEYPFSLRRFKDEFMEQIPQGVFRAKGLLWFVREPNRFIFHWSGNRYHVEEQAWPEDVERKNQLVVIGRQLDRDVIMRMLEGCVVRPGEESEEEDEDEIYGVMGGEYGAINEGEDGDGVFPGDGLVNGEDGAEDGGVRVGIVNGMPEGVEVGVTANGVDEVDAESKIER